MIQQRRTSVRHLHRNILYILWWWDQAAACTKSRANFSRWLVRIKILWSIESLRTRSESSQCFSLISFCVVVSSKDWDWMLFSLTTGVYLLWNFSFTYLINEQRVWSQPIVCLNITDLVRVLQQLLEGMREETSWVLHIHMWRHRCVRNLKAAYKWTLMPLLVYRPTSCINVVHQYRESTSLHFAPDCFYSQFDNFLYLTGR